MAQHQVGYICKLFLVMLAFIPPSLAQRNAEAEAICQPFLTSSTTSPLIVGLSRDLRVDEDGEFACELVLQDKFLPAQIRVTIHEGYRDACYSIPYSDPL